MITTASPRRPASRAVAISPRLAASWAPGSEWAAQIGGVGQQIGRQRERLAGRPAQHVEGLELGEPARGVAPQLLGDIEGDRSSVAEVAGELEQRAALGEADEGTRVEQYPRRGAGYGNHQSGSASAGAIPMALIARSTVSRSRPTICAKRSRSMRPAA